MECGAVFLVDDSVMHRFPDMSTFDRRIQRSEFYQLTHSTAASTALAENYVGLPY